MAAALVLGGAGNSYPLIGLVIQLLAAAVIAAKIPYLSWSRSSFLIRAAMFAIGALILLFIFQLLPLPSSVWRSMPYHQQASDILNATGHSGWRPISLTWDETLADMFCILVPIATFLVGISRRSDFLINCVRLTLAVAIGSVALSALQITGGDGLNIFYFYETGHVGSAVGLFVNRNHQAIFLNICIVLCAIPGIFTVGRAQQDGWSSKEGMLAAAVAAVFALGVMTTVSRAGLAFLPLAALGFLVVQWHSGANIKLLSLLAAVLVTGAGLIAGSYWTQIIAKRFELVENSKRFSTWDNTLFSIQEALPFGSGFGSFRSVYQSVEALESVDFTVSNHAHNEFLQILLEGGLPAAAICLAIIAILAVASFKSLKAPRLSRRQKTLRSAAAISVAFLVAHSIVDYPLRMAALAALFGLLSGILIAPPTWASGQFVRSQTNTLSRRKVGAAVVMLLISIPMAMIGLSRHLLETGNPEAAVAIWPFESKAWTAVADQKLLAKSTQEASAAAHNSLAIAPLQAAPLRNLALIADQNGEPEQFRHFLTLAGSLGWRDKPTQLLLVRQSLAIGDRAMMAQRLDSLLRRNYRREELNSLLAGVLGDEGANKEIAARLAERPQWRGGFIAFLARSAAVNAENFKSLAKSLKETDAPLSEREASAFLAGLVDDQRYEDAGSIWHVVSDGKQPGDGQFERVTGKLSDAIQPFAWRANKLFGTSIAIGPPINEWQRNAAIISGNGFSSGTVMDQLIALTPGSYSFSFVRQSERDTNVETGWTITCLAFEKPSFTIPISINWAKARKDWKLGKGVFTIPNSSCAGQRLSLQIKPIDGSSVRLQIDDVRIR